MLQRSPWVPTERHDEPAEEAEQQSCRIRHISMHVQNETTISLGANRKAPELAERAQQQLCRIMHTPIHPENASAISLGANRKVSELAEEAEQQSKRWGQGIGGPRTGYASWALQVLGDTATSSNIFLILRS